jgi:hypothetical protein
MALSGAHQNRFPCTFAAALSRSGPVAGRPHQEHPERRHHAVLVAGKQLLSALGFLDHASYRRSACFTTSAREAASVFSLRAFRRATDPQFVELLLATALPIGQVASPGGLCFAHQRPGLTTDLGQWLHRSDCSQIPVA